MNKRMWKKRIGILVMVLSMVFCMLPVQAAENAGESERVAGGAPQLLKVESARDTGLKLTWEASSQATDLSKVKYMILRSTDGGKSFQGLVNREAKYGLYFIDATGLEPGKEYFYKVREFVDGVQKQDSNVISAVAVQSGSQSNEFNNKSQAAAYLKEQMVQRNTNIQIIYNAAAFPSGLAAELYDDATKIDTESADPATADEGDYLRYTIVPGTIQISTGIDGKVGNDTSYVFNYSLQYYTSAEDEKAVDAVVDQVVAQFAKNGITKNSPDYEKAKAIYDYLTETVHYNKGARPDNGNLMITAYDALVRKEAQCYGQLMGAYRLFKEMGFAVRRVDGKANVELDGKTEWVNHGWIIVKIGDKWYNCDVTASASYYEGYGQKELKSYRYLLFTESEAAAHYQRGTEYAAGTEFYNSHPMGTTVYGAEPDAPGAPTLTLVDTNTVLIEYPTVAGADGYLVVRGESANGPFTVVGESTTNQYRDTSVKSGEYHYKVQAYKNVQGHRYVSGYSPRRIININGEIGTPTGVKAEPNSYNSIKISWDKTPGAQYYELFRSTSENEKYVKLGTYDANTFSAVSRSLACGDTYYYKVRAYKWSGGIRVYSDYSTPVSAKVVLPAPKNVQAKPNTYNTLKISWEGSEGANYYQVYRSTSANGKYALLGTYDSKTFNSISRSLACGTTYYYKVRAYRWVSGERVFSAFSTATTGTPALSAPTNVKAEPDTYNRLKISWEGVDGANYYQVYRASSANGKYALLGTYDSKTFNSFSRSLACGNTYYYKVRAYRWVGGERVFSPFSTVTTGKPVLAAPTGVKAAGATSTTVTVSWDKRAGAQFYQVYRSTSKTGKYSLLGVYDENRTSMTSRSLKRGTTYYYKVRGYRWVNGERVFSGWSTIVSATPR